MNDSLSFLVPNSFVHDEPRPGPGSDMEKELISPSTACGPPDSITTHPRVPDVITSGPPQEPTSATPTVPVFPPPPTSCLLGQDATSPASATFTDQDTLYAATSPTLSYDKDGVMKLPAVHEADTQSSSPAQEAGLIRRLLRSKSVVLLLTYASPLAGLAALVFAALHIVACFAILYASDHAPVAGWVYAPQVYLAVLTAISNKALAFAVVQGTVVTWWLKAMRGTTLAQLHYDWAAGLHVWQALGSGRHFSILAFACLCATFVAIDGPLLQSASSVKPEVPSKPVALQVAMAPQMPVYFSGWSNYPTREDWSSTDSTNDFLPILRSYSQGEPMQGFVSGCSGTCVTTIQAPALVIDRCITNSKDVDYTLPLNETEKEAWAITFEAPSRRKAFGTSSAASLGNRKLLTIDTSMSDIDVAHTCNGKRKSVRCWYASSIGHYPIRIENGIVTFLESPSRPTIVALSNNTAVTNETIEQNELLYPSGGYVRTTLSGMSQGLKRELDLEARLIPLIAGDTPTLSSGNLMLYQYVSNYPEWSSSADCAPEWIDPRDDMLAVANELMFRAGFYTAQRYNDSWFRERLDPGLEIHQNVTGIATSSVNVLVMDFRYFAGAAVLEVVTILAIFFTFYGWWRLNPRGV